MVAVSAARTVLVADDTAFVRERFQQALERGGHRAMTAATRTELLVRLREAGPGIDLVLLDLRLPQGRGPGLLKSIQEIQPEARVLVFSGTIASPAEVQELTALGVAGYVNEYVSVQHILPALSPHLFPGQLNRRSSPRVTLSVPVSYRAGNNSATSVTLNISQGGIGIRTTNPPEVGTTIALRFRLSRGAPEIDATARVAWIDSRIGMGLQFTVVDAAARTAIGDFVQAHFFTNRKA